MKRPKTLVRVKLQCRRLSTDLGIIPVPHCSWTAQWLCSISLFHTSASQWEFRKCFGTESAAMRVGMWERSHSCLPQLRPFAADVSTPLPVEGGSAWEQSGGDYLWLRMWGLVLALKPSAPVWEKSLVKKRGLDGQGQRSKRASHGLINFSLALNWEKLIFSNPARGGLWLTQGLFQHWRSNWKANPAWWARFLGYVSCVVPHNGVLIHICFKRKVFIFSIHLAFWHTISIFHHRT